MVCFEMFFLVVFLTIVIGKGEGDGGRKEDDRRKKHSGRKECFQVKNLGLYGSCDGFSAEQVSFGGVGNFNALSQLRMSSFGMGNSLIYTSPAIFPCRVEKFGGKLVTFSLKPIS